MRGPTRSRAKSSWIVASILAALSFRPARAIAEEPPARSSPEDAEPVVVERPEPIGELAVPYPVDGRGSSAVVLKLLVDVSGHVARAEVLEGQEPFARAALEASRGFSFRPARRNGVVEAAFVRVRLDFVEPPREPARTLAAPLANGPEPETPAEVVVEVEGERPYASARVLDDEATTFIPGASGDPIRALEILPGALPYVSGSPWLGVRGSAPARVGYDFDGVRIPYLYHTARAATVLHPWLIDQATLYGSAYPARYGRNAGGMITARAAEPEGRFRGYALAKITDSALGLEAPYAGGRGNVMLGGRLSYTAPIVSLVAPDYALDFWDYQARFRHEIGDGKRVEVLVFGAGDESQQTRPDGTTDYLFNAAFHRLDVRLDSFENGDRSRVAVTLGLDEWRNGEVRGTPRSQMIGVRTEREFHTSRRFRGAYGADLNFYDTREPDPDFDGPLVDVPTTSRLDLNSSLWLETVWEPFPGFSWSNGVRGQLYANGATAYSSSGVAVAPEPRSALSFDVSRVVRLHGSAGFASQLASDWFEAVGDEEPVGDGLEYGLTNDLGVELRLPEGLRVDATVYQSAFFETLDTNYLAFQVDQNSDGRGQGRAVGVEFTVARTVGRLRGLVGYTLSRSDRSLGRAHTVFRLDRTHVLNAALGYDFGSGYRFAFRGTFYTGFPATLDRLSRLPGPRTDDHYQFDWRFEKRFELAGSAYLTALAEVLNTTARREPDQMYCDVDGCFQGLIGPVIVPSIGVEGGF